MRNVLCFLAIIIGLSFSQTVHAATLTVPAGGDLQSAINAAQPGDTIIVQAGTIYTGPFSLPLKSGDAYISIQSSRLSELPADTRVNPSQSALFAKLQSASPAEPVLKTAAGAHHYRFLGIEFSTANASVLVYDLIRLGEGRELQTGLDSVPHHLTLDRCYIHGFDTQDVQRGIALNSAETTISNSYISEIHGVGFDTQAICGWNGPGPFHIINNYLEGAGENVLFGGADPGIFGLVPSDIEIRGNLVSKPLTWKVGDPSYLGRHWTIKNLLELKNARRVIIDGNIFQNNWPDAQIGIPILFTARNQDGTAPWSVVEFVSFTNNTVRNAEGGVHILRTDAESRGAITSDITISNNVFDEIKGNGFLVLINNPNNITAVHNTVFKNRNIVTIDARTIDPQGTGLIIKDNLFSEGDYGVHGSGVGEGTIALSTFFAGYVFEKNNLAGRDVSLYAFGNTFFGTDQVGFTDYLNRNYKLTITSPLKGKATDGKDVGADIDVLNAAQSGASAPVPSPSPSPSPTPLPSPSPTPTPLPSPSPSPTPTPAPSPSPTPAPTPAPSPSPSPTPAPTPRCSKMNPKGKCLKWQ